MDRPNVPAMDEIGSVLQDIKDMENAIDDLKKRLRDLPARVSEQLGTFEERVNAAQYLYWMFPKLSAKSIGRGMLGLNEYKFRELIDSVEASVKCGRCKQQIRFRSRSHMSEIAKLVKADEDSTGAHYEKGFKILCDGCSREVAEEYKREYERDETMRRARVGTLKTMPYVDFLRTMYWQERRREHLQSTGYSCQVCNARDVTLDVHHRTYARRGQEHYTDLLTLCRDCHGLFHREGRLAE